MDLFNLDKTLNRLVDELIPQLADLSEDRIADLQESINLLMDRLEIEIHIKVLPRKPVKIAKRIKK